MGSRVSRIVSGGQTGVDRAALLFARRVGIAVGGWCPADGWAEDLVTPPGLVAVFPELRPVPSADPRLRTVWNVRDSDATLVLVRSDAHSPGTDLTVATAAELGKPHMVADVDEADAVRTWLAGLPEGVALNVAGPRESEAPGIAGQVELLLDAVLGRD